MHWVGGMQVLSCPEGHLGGHHVCTILRSVRNGIRRISCFNVRNIHRKHKDVDPARDSVASFSKLCALLKEVPISEERLNDRQGLRLEPFSILSYRI